MADVLRERDQSQWSGNQRSVTMAEQNVMRLIAIETLHTHVERKTLPRVSRAFGEKRGDGPFAAADRCL